MTDREAKRLEKERKHQAERELWKDMSDRHWSHWRAWGSWFSWGSPVGLGLFFLLMAVSAAVLVYVIKL